MLKSLKKYISSILPFYFLKKAKWVYHNPKNYWMPPPIKNINFHIKAVLDSLNRPFHFIQIGSNNGSLNDPLYPFFSQYQCKGVLIEPVPYIFEELKKTYADFKHLSFENIAISDHNGTIDFYVVKKSDDPNIPSWYNQLSSFDPKFILKHKNQIPNIESLIEKTNLPCRTIQSLVDQYQINDLDILHIDTEGYDYEIIKTIDFNKLHPAILYFEHNHLSKSQYKECLRLLHTKYKTIYRNTTWDTICLNPRR
ncbi:MAG: FkbM family methyltransferase [Chitinophagaceae bacterium]|nr:FkbM family methyltransferase [Chitinophagaceae bacterium]